MILLIIVSVILSILFFCYLKHKLRYHGLRHCNRKYRRFYQKLYKLTDSVDHVTNTFVETSDKIFLDTVYIRNPNTHKSIIFFPGYAGNLAMRYEMIRFLYNYASVIIFDYRSYGRSSNSPCSASALEKDAYAIWKYVIDNLKISANQISFFGESLGCSIAINLAAHISSAMDPKYYPDSLILTSPFYSLSSMIVSHFKKLGLSYLGYFISFYFHDVYRSDDMIRLINQKIRIVIAHSLQDEVIPYSESLRLYKLISDNPAAKFITLSGTHNRLGLTEDYIYTLAGIFHL